MRLVTGCTPPPLTERPSGEAFAVSPLHDNGERWTGPPLGWPPGISLQSAVQLTSSEPRFGGWSGISLSRDEAGHSQITAISDRGYWLRATIAPTTNALTSPRFGRLYGPDGTPLTDNSSRDAEDLVVLADGRIVVSLERQHRLWLYPAPATADEPLFKAAPHAIPLPPDFPAAVSHNAGIEAMTQLADGRLVILTEGQSGADHSALWVSRDAAWDTDPAWHRHDLRINAGYHPTAIAELANGDLVVLERRFILPLGLSNRLRRISRDSLNNDQPAPLDGPVILSLDRPPVSDNFEGLASQPTGPGATTLHMISDNNYTSLQRTLMVSLSLADTP